MFNCEQSESVPLPSDTEILISKLNNPYTLKSNAYQHNDCIRIAYIWLDHQKVTKRPRFTASSIKHDIERWAQRYISSTTLLLAAHMHPDIIIGRARSSDEACYILNIHRNFVIPPIHLLYNIPEAFKHPHYADKIA